MSVTREKVVALAAAAVIAAVVPGSLGYTSGRLEAIERARTTGIGDVQAASTEVVGGDAPCRAERRVQAVPEEPDESVLRRSREAAARYRAERAERRAEQRRAAEQRRRAAERSAGQRGMDDRAPAQPRPGYERQLEQDLDEEWRAADRQTRPAPRQERSQQEGDWSPPAAPPPSRAAEPPALHWSPVPTAPRGTVKDDPAAPTDRRGPAVSPPR